MIFQKLWVREIPRRVVHDRVNVVLRAVLRAVDQVPILYKLGGRESALACNERCVA